MNLRDKTDNREFLEKKPGATEECRFRDDWLNGELPPDLCDAFERHAAGCSACRDAIDSDRELRDSLQPLAECRMPDDADLRLRIQLERRLRRPQTGPDVMDIEGAAAFLGLSVSELIEHMDELPAFEIGGRIRFNRRRLEAWMEAREKESDRTVRRGGTGSRNNLLPFPGGTTDDEFKSKIHGGTV